MKNIKGEKIKEVIPVNRIEEVKESFKDFDLDYEKDLKDSTLIINETGSCFLKHEYKSEFFEPGILLCVLSLDGSYFRWGKNGKGFR